MNNNYLKANRIRMNLLLFIDKEIRNKFPNISEFNNSNHEIQFEEIFSNDGEIIKYSNLNLTDNFSNKEDQNRNNIIKKSAADNKHFHISFKDIRYEHQSRKKFSSTMLFINTEKINKDNSKEYLKSLCNDLLILRKKISKRTFTFHSKSKKKRKLSSSKKNNKESKIKIENKKIIPKSSMLVTAFQY